VSEATTGATVPGRYGAGDSQLVFGEATIAAAWNVQGEAARRPFVDAVQRIFGTALPIAPNTTMRRDALSVFWLGPHSWLLVAGGVSPLTDFGRARDALNTAGGALFDVSASRVAYVVAGPRATDVLASGCPLDLHPRAFVNGACAQSLFSRVNALIYRYGDPPSFTLFVAGSFARDTWQALCLAGAQHGYTVRAPAPFR